MPVNWRSLVSQIEVAVGKLRQDPRFEESHLYLARIDTIDSLLRRLCTHDLTHGEATPESIARAVRNAALRYKVMHATGAMPDFTWYEILAEEKLLALLEIFLRLSE
jgi:hypothetical protein